MKLGTAFCVLAVVGSLAAADRERSTRPRQLRHRIISMVLALVPLAFGGILAAEYWLRVDLGLRRWFLTNPPPFILEWATKPSPATALSLILTGVALLTWRRPRGLWFFSLVTGAIVALAWLGLAGIIFGVHDSVRTTFFSTLSMPTALSLFAISAGLFCLRPSEGMARLFSSPRHAGRLARWLVPAGALVTLALGSVRLWAQGEYRFSTELGVALYGTAMFVAMTLIGLRGAYLIDRLERRRERSEKEKEQQWELREAAIERLKNSEAALALSNERFRGIFNSTFQYIWLLSREGIVLEANQTALGAVGGPLDKLLGQPFLDTPWCSYSPEQRERVQTAITFAVTQGASSQFEMKMRGSDGSAHYVDFTLKPIRDADGRVIYLVPEGHDVTERKRAEDELVANEELLRQFVVHTPAAVAMLDRQMRYMQASEQYLRDYHLDGQDIIGRWHYEVFPDIPQHWKDMHQRVLAGAVERREEELFARRDGSMEWLQWETRPWRKSGGEIGGLIFYTQVITRRKLAESKVRESEERFRGAFENSAIGMALVSMDGHWLKVNPALCHLVGRTEKELLACTFQEITHPEDLETDLRLLQELADGKIDHYQLEKRYLHARGNIVRILLAVTLVRDGQGHPVHFVAQIEDVTVRYEAASRIQASLEEKEVLLREIHHRVKNNMQVIISLLRLHSAHLTDERARAVFDECQARIHAMGLIHDRLYRSGNLATIDFSEHLRELAALIMRGLSRGASRVQLDVQSESVEVDLDTAIPLGLITAELITNAYKHAFSDDRTGRIEVQLRRIGDRHLELQVRDNGPGLPADLDIQKTTSLGLRLVQALSRQLDGELSLNPAATGGGVRLTLPI